MEGKREIEIGRATPCGKGGGDGGGGGSARFARDQFSPLPSPF